MQQIKPHLRSNGGNVLMVQMENEFGSYGNTGANNYQNGDADYVRTLQKWALQELGGADAVQLYSESIDSPSMAAAAAVTNYAASLTSFTPLQLRTAARLAT